MTDKNPVGKENAVRRRTYDWRIVHAGRYLICRKLLKDCNVDEGFVLGSAGAEIC